MSRADAPSGTGEYVSDVAYVRHFTDDLAPENLRLVAALNGFVPPPADHFDYCELGCGNGDTTATLAACYPDARFTAVDFNGEHIEFARGLAARGELSNVRFLQRDFEALLEDELPSFDYIAAFGVLSWVSPVKWRAVVELARRKLKPGGLFYASYNAMPGRAAVDPLRRLLVDTTRGIDDSLERARRGMDIAKVLAAGGAAYFKSHPAAAKMLDTLVHAPGSYIAHEYFHAHWRSMYFGDVAEELGESGLHFIGQLPLYMNYRDLTIPPALMELFKRVDDRIVFESLKDYAVDEGFRRDVYIAGAAPRAASNTTAHLDGARFGTLVAAREIAREIPLPHHTLRYAGPIFDVLVPAIARRASTVAELAALPELAAFGAPKVRDAVRNLAIGGQVVVMSGTPIAERADETGLYRVPSAYNRMVLQQPLVSRTTFVLASPVARTGITITLLEAMAMRLVTTVVPSMRKAFVRTMVESDPLELRVRGKLVDEPAEQERILNEELAKFSKEKLPRMIALGILEPVDEESA